MAQESGARTFTVRLAIGRGEYERLYRGQATTVVARDVHGRTIQFPALSLRPFLGHDGIFGTFVIRVSDSNRLLEISRRPG